MKTFILIVLIAFCSAQDVPEENSDVIDAVNETTYKTLSFERDEEIGSGQKPCDMHYIVYDKKYLRGVTGSFHEQFNKTDFQQCAKLCCYETKFNCVSFSHFAILEQCWLMDVTQADERFILVDAPGFVHVQLVEPTTTAPPTTTTRFVTPSFRPPFQSTKAPKSDKSVATKKVDPEDNTPGPSSAGKLVGSSNNLCTKKCDNGGNCATEQNTDGETSLRCDCPEGFEGEACEKESTPVEKEGFPTYLIAVIVVIAVLLILLIVVIVFCQIQKRKTGEYRVFGALREWARKVRRPKKAISNDFFAPDEPYHSSTVKSSGSLYDTIGRTPGPQSTSTSV